MRLEESRHGNFKNDNVDAAKDGLNQSDCRDVPHSKASQHLGDSKAIYNAIEPNKMCNIDFTNHGNRN